MRRLLEVGRTGVTSLLLYPLRSVVVGSCVLVVLAPYLVGLGISYGIQSEAEASLRGGADLYVSGLQMGQRVPISLDWLPAIARIEGVTSVVPRIVGSIELGKNRESAVLVGLPCDHFPPVIQCVEGRLPRSGSLHELVIGAELAERLELRVGAMIPPFYQNDQGERVSKVVGIFRSDVSLWQAKLVLTTLEAAAAIFDQPELASDFLVECQPGVEPFIRDRILQTLARGPSGKGGGTRVTVTTREELRLLLPQGLLHREGIFHLHFTLMFIATILVVLVTSGLGHSERRREIGILKATGWQTDEVLLRSLVESVLLSLISGCLAILLSLIWLRGFNGFGIASIYLPGVDVAPAFRVPFRLAPFPAALVLLLSFVLVLTGTLYSSWRAATVSPLGAMR